MAKQDLEARVAALEAKIGSGPGAEEQSRGKAAEKQARESSGASEQGG